MTSKKKLVHHFSPKQGNFLAIIYVYSGRQSVTTFHITKNSF